MTFKMKGPSLYKNLSVNRNGYANMPDGKSKSSAFQKTELPDLSQEKPPQMEDIKTPQMDKREYIDKFGYPPAPEGTTHYEQQVKQGKTKEQYIKDLKEAQKKEDAKLAQILKEADPPRNPKKKVAKSSLEGQNGKTSTKSKTRSIWTTAKGSTPPEEEMDNPNVSSEPKYPEGATMFDKVFYDKEGYRRRLGINNPKKRERIKERKEREKAEVEAWKKN